MNNQAFPSAYFITFTTYGNWVHADERGSVNPKHNIYGEPRIIANKNFESLMRSKHKHEESWATIDLFLKSDRVSCI